MESKACACQLCDAPFPSKMKLFKHLETAHGYQNNNRKPDKVVILFGWISDTQVDLIDEFSKETVNSNIAINSLSVEVEGILVRAINEVERDPSESNDSSYSITRSQLDCSNRGFTRASYCSQRNMGLMGLDPSNHAVCDVMSFPSKKLWPGTEKEWIDKVNALLPSNVRVFSRIILPSADSDFNAEISCTQRRFECLLPLDIVMPPELALPPAEPIVRKRKGRIEYPKATITRGGDKELSWTEMDKEFPADTPEGQARIEYFRKLKRLLKKFGGRHSMHNFVTGGACPDDTSTKRKLDRIYHKDIVCFPNSKNWVVISLSGDSFLRGEVRKLMGLMLAIQLQLLPPEYFEAAIESKDTIEDVPSIPGYFCYLAECRFAFLESKYQGSLVLDPHRAGEVEPTVGSSDISMLEDWKAAVQLHIYNCYEASLHEAASRDPEALAATANVKPAWFGEFVAECARINEKYSRLLPLRTRDEAALSQALSSIIQGQENLSEDELRELEAKFNSPASEATTTTTTEIMEVDPGEGSNSTEIASEEANDPAAAKEKTGKKPLIVVSPEEKLRQMMLLRTVRSKQSNAPAAYHKVLRLLREADMSGQWPSSSSLRQKVIADASLSENGGIGGSFSVGKMPKPFPDPKGNSLFPELMLACFELEMLVAPHRTPSSTIAINKHAQFRPHRDSGAGSGQCISLIVGLGDYAGGEIVVETEAHDIRYKPIEFDGWSSRHYTLPFAGERFSLVWFTPFGIELEDLWWWKTNENGERVLIDSS